MDGHGPPRCGCHRSDAAIFVAFSTEHRQRTQADRSGVPDGQGEDHREAAAGVKQQQAAVWVGLLSGDDWTCIYHF